MSHPLWYTYSIDNMKNETTNIKAGQFWFNLKTDETIRVTTIVPCTGVFGVNSLGEGYGEVIKFDDLRKARLGEWGNFRTKK